MRNCIRLSIVTSSSWLPDVDLDSLHRCNHPFFFVYSSKLCWNTFFLNFFFLLSTRHWDSYVFVYCFFDWNLFIRSEDEKGREGNEQTFDIEWKLFFELYSRSRFPLPHGESSTCDHRRVNTPAVYDSTRVQFCCYFKIKIRGTRCGIVNCETTRAVVAHVQRRNCTGTSRRYNSLEASASKLQL